MTDQAKDPLFRPSQGQHRWENVPVLDYKAEGSAPFKDISRQILFADEAMAAELRYFEIGPGGHSTLERHEHLHAVMIVRGGGRCLIGNKVHSISTHDLIKIPSMTWHQFRASPNAPLGFLCMVNRDRDRPQLPTAQDLAALRQIPDIAAFLGRDE